jgi:hypothetical protein
MRDEKHLPSLDEEDTYTADTSVNHRSINVSTSETVLNTNPTRICLGKKPTIAPSFSAPKRRNDNPEGASIVRKWHTIGVAQLTDGEEH